MKCFSVGNSFFYDIKNTTVKMFCHFLFELNKLSHCYIKLEEILDKNKIVYFILPLWFIFCRYFPPWKIYSFQKIRLLKQLKLNQHWHLLTIYFLIIVIQERPGKRATHYWSSPVRQMKLSSLPARVFSTALGSRYRGPGENLWCSQTQGSNRECYNRDNC